MQSRYPLHEIAEGLFFLEKLKHCRLQSYKHSKLPGHNVPNLSLKKSPTLYECFERMQIRAYLFWPLSALLPQQHHCFLPPPLNKRHPPFLSLPFHPKPFCLRGFLKLCFVIWFCYYCDLNAKLLQSWLSQSQSANSLFSLRRNLMSSNVGNSFYSCSLTNKVYSQLKETFMLQHYSY